MDHVSPSILFRCDGSSKIGLGHVFRCLALADAFRQAHDCRVTFAMRRDPLGFRLCEEHGYRVMRGLTPNLPDDGVWLRNIRQEIEADVLILDVRDDLPREVIQRLREEGLLIVTIDDPTDRRLDADLAFYPPIPQLKHIDWYGFSGKRFVGWDWVVTRPEFTQIDLRHAASVPPVILVTMGGSDPGGMTIKAIEGLNGMGLDCEVQIVLGPGFLDERALEQQLERAPYAYTIKRHVTNMWEVMSQADLCVAAFGSTAYELAAMQVPSVLMGLTEDHVTSASTFVDEGIATCLGVHECVTPKMIGDEVRQLLQNPVQLDQMRVRAKHIMGGGGSYRIAQTIIQEWQCHYESCQGMATAQR